MATVTGIRKQELWCPIEVVSLDGLDVISNIFGRIVTLIDSVELQKALSENSSSTGILTVFVIGEDGEKYILSLETKYSR